MLGRSAMLLAYCCFLYLIDCEVNMTKKGLENTVRGFRIAGIIVAPIWGIISIIKELSSINLVEWAENGVLEHIRELGRGIILILLGCFIVWILHVLSMFILHKLWPDTYDKYGHMRK